MLIRATLLALAALGQVPAASAQDASVYQIQFRGRPDGGCPRGYDFNFSNGRCYPNDYHAPGAYNRPAPEPYGDGYYRHHRYGAYPGYGYEPRYYDR